VTLLAAANAAVSISLIFSGGCLCIAKCFGRVLTIVGQQLVSILVDRFGLLRDLGLCLTGVALLLAGVALILML
jgi:hypothetical protein